MIRVLHIVGRMDRAGAETMVMNLYREIDRTRFQFDFVYFTPERCDYDEEINALGGRIFQIPSSNPFGRLLGLRSLLRTGEWQIVHSHTLFSSALHLGAAHLAGVSHRIAHSHNTQDASETSLARRPYQRAARWLLNQVSTRPLACGRAAAAYLFPGRQDVVLIPNAVDLDRFAHARGGAVRADFGIRDRQVAIIQVGRLLPVKNHVRSLAIACALRRAGIDFVMLLAGTGAEQTRIEALVRENRLGDCVRLLGLRTDIPELMAAADVMLMPSIHEGFPVVLVEAQAAGLPSIVSSAVSPEVDVGLGMVHFVALGASDEEWVTAIRRAADSAVPDPGRRRSVLEAAGYSAAAGAKRLEAVYAAP